MIDIFTRSNYKISRKLIIGKIISYLKKYGFDESHSLNIILVGIRKMRQVAKKYKKEDLALPVLSFSYLQNNMPQSDNEKVLIGEIFICYPQAVLLAAEREREVDNIIIELIEHGIDSILK